MLDMGFLPDIRRILKHIPAKRQTLFFSATMPGRSSASRRRCCATRRRSISSGSPRRAVGITQAVYPVARELKSALLVELLKRDDHHDAIVFTRTKHRANRLADYLERHGDPDREDPRQPQPGPAHRGARGLQGGQPPVLVATDIVARGIDIEDLGHVVNFDVPGSRLLHPPRGPHGARRGDGGRVHVRRAGRRADLRAIEQAIGKRLPRVTLPGFDYTRKPEERLEIPIHERLAAHRAQKAAGRSRSAESAGGASRAHARPKGHAAGTGHGSGASRHGSGGAGSSRHGSGAPARRAGGRGPDSRLQAILDRHAPPSGGSGSGTGGRPRGRGGR